MFVQSLNNLEKPKRKIMDRDDIRQTAQDCYGHWPHDTKCEQDTVNSIDGGRTFSHQTLTRSM